MTYTASQVNSETKCWMVRRWKVPEHNLDISAGKIFISRRWRSINNTDYTEAEVWGAKSEQEAIEMAKARESWA